VAWQKCAIIASIPMAGRSKSHTAQVAVINLFTNKGAQWRGVTPGSKGVQYVAQEVANGVEIVSARTHGPVQVSWQDLDRLLGFIAGCGTIRLWKPKRGVGRNVEGHLTQLTGRPAVGCICDLLAHAGLVTILPGRPVKAKIV
jgi:hypothetical protein